MTACDTCGRVFEGNTDRFDIDLFDEVKAYQSLGLDFLMMNLYALLKRNLWEATVVTSFTSKMDPGLNKI